MFKKTVTLLAVTLAAASMLTGCSLLNFEDMEDDVVVEVAPQEPVVQTAYDEEFLKVFAEAVTYRQDLGERVSFALTPTDVLEKELEKHPDYANMTFNDEVLKTYAVHYREAVAEQLKYWKISKKKDKDWEGYKEDDFSKAIRAWITQVDAVNALVEEYNLPIDDKLAKEYKLERYFWSSGLYTPSWENYSNNTEILFSDMKVNSSFDEALGDSKVELKLKNLTKHDLTGIHIYVYHWTKGGYVLEEEIPVDTWGIDSEVDKEYTVHEKYSSRDHVFDAGSGLPLTLYPNRIIYNK